MIPRTAGFLGLYTRVALVERVVAPEHSERVAVLTVELPATEYPRALEIFGSTPGQPDTGPNILVLRAGVPGRPRDETNVRLEAVIAEIEAIVDAGTARFDVRLVRRIEAIARAVPFQPLHVEREP